MAPQSSSHLPTIGPLIAIRLLIVLATVLAMLGPTTGSSQTDPSRPVRIVIGFAPGGTPEQFGAVIRAEHEKFGRLVKLSGAKLE